MFLAKAAMSEALTIRCGALGSRQGQRRAYCWQRYSCMGHDLVNGLILILPRRLRAIALRRGCIGARRCRIGF